MRDGYDHPPRYGGWCLAICDPIVTRHIPDDDPIWDELDPAKETP